MELTDEQLRILSFFAKYLKVKKANVVSKNIYIDSDGIIDEAIIDNDWFNTENKIGIETIDEVDRLILNILENNRDVLNLFSDIGGHLEIYFNAEERKIEFKAEVNIFDYRTIDSDSVEIDEESDLWEWFTEMRNNGYKKAHVHYEGGGDNGFIHNNMDVERIGSSDLVEEMKTPDFVASYIEARTTYNWWDNEGGQGDFIFDFVNETIESEQEENYESTKEVDVPLEINF